ncbi:TetR/AcrR family transcriptional regulator [Pseudokineococcus sp. 5B2Z-1]|uniref:TetR/AcrR family transcriptional regulator n=1 Tax=Pseudokineococcus sp. 5B2Z-1 TaxID=3132744 RepID=UPI0030A6C5D9
MESGGEDVRRRVRELVRDAEGTQREYAAAVGMDPVKLSKSLTGVRRFRPEELAAVAERSGVGLGWLVRGRGSGPRPRPRRTAAPRDARRREEILEATWRLVARRGYSRLRLADVAERCGTSPAAVHHHFPSKRVLVLEALMRCVERAFERQRRDVERLEDPWERVLRVLELQVPSSRQVRDEWSVWLQVSGEAAVHPELREVQGEFHLHWRRLVSEAVRHGVEQGRFADVDPERVAVALMALADGLAVQLLTGTPGCTPRTMHEHLRRLAERELLPAG